MNNEKLELTVRGNNANIKAHILSEAKMREIGFTDSFKDNWYFSRSINGVPNISFNLSIVKSTGFVMIDVLDESFLQPYDYQYMLDSNPKFAPALAVKEGVEEWMTYLTDNGIISGHKYGDYI